MLWLHVWPKMVKSYPEGKKDIVELEPGDTLECKGPIPKLPYKANMKKSLGMVHPLMRREARSRSTWLPHTVAVQPVSRAAD